MDYNPLPLTIRQLQYAVAVADTLSFRQAAERCHVSQPPLSAQLSQMEKALGIQLFERDRRRVLITPQGRDFIERARQILKEVDDLIASARCAGDLLTGTLTIGIIPTVSPYLLPRLSARLREAFPQLTIFWHEDKSGTLANKLAAGELDAALLALEADIGEVEHEVITHDPFVLATPVGHPLGESQQPARLSDLQHATVLLLDDGHCFREQALAVCTHAKADELEFRATSLSTLAQMVAGGTGVTLLPKLAATTESQRARLALRPFAQPEPQRTIALVWRPRSPLAPALRKLATTAQKTYDRHTA